jgi:hypothetical protein
MDYAVPVEDGEKGLAIGGCHARIIPATMAANGRG